MNKLNSATQEASQRLVDAGIVLETEKSWIYARHIALKSAPSSWMLYNSDSLLSVTAIEKRPSCVIPAPSMAEVCRELPEDDEELIELISKYNDFWIPGTMTLAKSIIRLFRDVDALIDFLIWVRIKK